MVGGSLRRVSSFYSKKADEANSSRGKKGRGRGRGKGRARSPSPVPAAFTEDEDEEVPQDEDVDLSQEVRGSHEVEQRVDASE